MLSVLSYLPVLAICLVTVAAFYHVLIFPFLLSPLRHIPRAHWSVPIPYVGSVWILYQRYQSRNNAATAAAHDRRGPIVRLGENEISVNCYEGGLKTVYAGGWEKHEWYPRQFQNYGTMNMFSTVGHHAHAQKKRIMANIYSKSYLQNSPQIASNSQKLLCERFLPLVQRLAETGEPVDVLETSAAFTMDFMTAYQFGITNSTNFTENVEVRRKYLHLYHSRRHWQFISSELPGFIRRSVRYLGIELYPAFIHRANEWLEEWSRNMCEAAQKDSENPPSPSKPIGSEPVVFRQYKNGLRDLRQKDVWAGHEFHAHLDEGMNFTKKQGLAKTSQPPDEETTTLEVYSDMVDQLAAGHETSAVTLTYLYYELSKTPSLQERLHTELATVLPQITWPATNGQAMPLPTFKDIDKLPFLNALLLETLRLHPAIPGIQPRVSPQTPGGVSLGPPGTQHHYTGLPGNIRVSAMPYTLHKIEHVFPKPQSFNPDRWLTSSDDAMREMNRHFWAFGSGGRMCIGSHLATLQIKLIIASIYTNYRTGIVDDDGIDEIDAYTTRPTSGKLMLRFEKR